MNYETTAERVALIQSNRAWSSLDDVATAVSVASQGSDRLYVERKGTLFRWSLAHPGGGYPILRITARFLKVDYQRIFVGFRTLPNGDAIICENPNSYEAPDAWTSIEQDLSFSADEAQAFINDALAES